MNRLMAMVLPRVSWVIAAGIILLGVVTVPAFQRPAYWLSLSQQDFAAAALALALTPIILTGGIDLSVGSVTVFVSVVIGTLWRDLGWPIHWAMAAGILTGFLAGLGNGAMVTAGVPSLIATLASRELFRGLAMALSGDNPVTRFPLELGDLWNEKIFKIPVTLFLLAGLFLVSYLVVHHTWMGRMLFALGDNERAARFAGVPVRRLKLGIYGWSGLVAGLCGAAIVCKYGSAKANAESSLEMVAIACVVLGGIRITGGAGHVGGTVVGIITVSTLMAGLGSIDATWRDMVMGGILVTVAIANETAARWARRMQFN